MAKCPDCSKFTSLEFNDPEVDNLEVSDDGTISATVRIVRCCSDCGTEIKEATFEMEVTPTDESLKEHINKEGETKHVLEVEETGVDQIEEGGGRYAKSYFGAEVAFEIMCQCDAESDDRWSIEGTVSDKIAASEMDELV